MPNSLLARICFFSTIEAPADESVMNHGAKPFAELLGTRLLGVLGEGLDRRQLHLRTFLGHPGAETQRSEVCKTGKHVGDTRLLKSLIEILRYERPSLSPKSR